MKPKVPFSYFNGEEENPFEHGTKEYWYWRDEECFYLGVYLHPEEYEEWKKCSERDNKDEYPMSRDEYYQYPQHIQVMLTHAIWLAWNMNPCGGERYLKHYGDRYKLTHKMVKYITYEGNDYTPEEDYWRQGGNTGTLPQRITPSHVNVLKNNEVFVFGSNFHGHHMGGAANVANKKFGAIWGVGEGLQGQSYAIPTMEGIDNLIPAIERFTSFAKQHHELIFWVTRIGCGIAGYKDEDIALYFREAAYLGNVCLPLSFWQIIMEHPLKEGEFEKIISNLIDVCKYMHKHCFPTWNTITDDNIIDSLERDVLWELGKQLGVISPNEEEPNTKGLPQDLVFKITSALRSVE